MAQAAQGDPNKFITITSRYRPEEMTPSAAAQQLVHAWRMVVQRGKREKLFKDMQYIAVFELTKQGWPHLHILARCSFVHQAWLAARMQQYADSPICHVRAVKGKSRAAWYVAKYTAKAPEKFMGCKRYWRTKGYDPTPGKSDKPLHDHFKGYCMDWKIRDVAGLYLAHAYDLDWTSEHSFVAYPTELDMHAFVRNKYPPKLTKPYKEHHRCVSISKVPKLPSTAQPLRFFK
jgi:hypothetical protein